MIFPSEIKKLLTGPNFALAVFIAVVAHCAFMWPYFIILPEERINLFTSIAAFVAFIPALIFGDRQKITPRQILFAATLTILVLLSGYFSSTPFSSFMRGAGLITASVCGYFCIRLLLGDPGRFKVFIISLNVIFFIMTALGWLCWFHYQEPYGYVDVNPHPFTNKLFLLATGPLLLVVLRARFYLLPIIGALIAYPLLILSHLRITAIIPVILSPLAVYLSSGRLMHFILITTCMLLGLLFFFFTHPDKMIRLNNYEPLYYRAENYPFSLYIALKNPILGNGLRAPRTEYLEDYTMRFSLAKREAFLKSTRRIVSSDNLYLNFLAELGFPFTILYLSFLGLLLWRTVKRGVQDPKSKPFILALALPLLAAGMHYLVFDGLLFPQLAFLFHLFLGLLSLFLDKEEPFISLKLPGKN